MGFWHGVEYYEKERHVGEEFYKEWNDVSIDLIVVFASFKILRTPIDILILLFLLILVDTTFSRYSNFRSHHVGNLIDLGRNHNGNITTVRESRTFISRH